MTHPATTRPPKRRDPFVSPPRTLLARLLTSEPGSGIATGLLIAALVLAGPDIAAAFGNGVQP